MTRICLYPDLISELRFDVGILPAPAWCMCRACAVCRGTRDGAVGTESFDMGLSPHYCVSVALRERLPGAVAGAERLFEHGTLSW
jgi:hypothetical protein